MVQSYWAMKMSRCARKLSQSGLYHIVFRGIGRQNIFEENADYEKLKEIILKVKEEMNLKLYAYCFMTNHVHLFVKEKELGDISKSVLERATGISRRAIIRICNKM